MMGNYITKKFKSLLPVVGILIIITMMAAMWFWESYGRQRLLYQKVVVFKENQNRGAVVNEDMLKVVRRPVEDVFKAAIVNKEQIIGKGVNHFVPAGATLHPSFFDEPSLIEDKNSVIFRVPNEWVLSVPESIRRGDKAVFYEADSIINNKNLSNANTQVKDGSLPTNPVSATESLKAIAGSEVIKARIAYVKDSSNKEVINASNRDRYDGTGKVSSIEIITTKEDVERLKERVKNGYKFIVLYSEDEEVNK